MKGSVQLSSVNQGRELVKGILLCEALQSSDMSDTFYKVLAQYSLGRKRSDLHSSDVLGLACKQHIQRDAESYMLKLYDDLRMLCIVWNEEFIYPVISSAHGASEKSGGDQLDIRSLLDFEDKSKNRVDKLQHRLIELLGKYHEQLQLHHQLLQAQKARMGVSAYHCDKQLLIEKECFQTLGVQVKLLQALVKQEIYGIPAIQALTSMKNVIRGRKNALIPSLKAVKQELAKYEELTQSSGGQFRKLLSRAEDLNRDISDKEYFLVEAKF